MKMTRHIGLHAKTSARISLILTVLPDSEDCLIVYPDNLPHELKDSFFYIMNSQEGQSAVNLSDVLAGRTYADTNQSMLQVLHSTGFIKKAHIDDILMTPSAAYKIPLRDVLIQSGLMKESVSQITDAEPYNPHKYNANAESIAETVGSAQNLLVEAEMLDQAASQKREQAYRIAPSLRPGYVAPEPESIDFPKDVVIEPVDIMSIAADLTEAPTE